MKRLLSLLFIAALFGSLSVNAQTESNAPAEETNSTSDREALDFGISFEEPLVQDAAYEKIGVKQKIALPYDHLREADVLWSKRIWRVIDTNEKMNLPFKNPNQAFIEVLFDILQKNPDVQLFTSDRFTEEGSGSDIQERLSSIDTVQVWDYELDDYVDKVTKNEFNADDYQKFRLKEDWLFDEETSTMVCRILGIAPIRDVRNEDGSVRGQEALFWVYYPDIREKLVNYEAINPENDAVALTWEDVFEMRYFSSYIMKESNPQDRRISEYATGKEALKESARIIETILNKEVDIWEY